MDLRLVQEVVDPRFVGAVEQQTRDGQDRHPVAAGDVARVQVRRAHPHAAVSAPLGRGDDVDCVIQGEQPVRRGSRAAGQDHVASRRHNAAAEPAAVRQPPLGRHHATMHPKQQPVAHRATHRRRGEPHLLDEPGHREHAVILPRPPLDRPPLHAKRTFFAMYGRNVTLARHAHDRGPSAVTDQRASVTFLCREDQVVEDRRREAGLEQHPVGAAEVVEAPSPSAPMTSCVRAGSVSARPAAAA